MAYTKNNNDANSTDKIKFTICKGVADKIVSGNDCSPCVNDDKTNINSCKECDKASIITRDDAAAAVGILIKYFNEMDDLEVMFHNIGTEIVARQHDYNYTVKMVRVEE